jgi:hypothetical protein
MMMMTDKPLSDLFAEGTAPESDPDFALRVATGIGRARLRIRLGALALRAAGALALSGAVFLAAGLIRPVLLRLVDGAPQFMGVPVPVVLGGLIAGLALLLRRRVLSSHPGAGFLEPVE